MLEGYFVSGFILNGVRDGSKNYPNSYLAPIIFGTISGTGGLFIQPPCINAYLGVNSFQSLASDPNIFFAVPFVLSIYQYVSSVLHLIPDVINLPVEIPNFPFSSISVSTIVRIVVVLEFLYIWFISSFLPLFASSGKSENKATKASTPKAPKAKTSDIDESSDVKSTSASPATTLSKRKNKRK